MNSFVMRSHYFAPTAILITLIAPTAVPGQVLVDHGDIRQMLNDVTLPGPSPTGDGPFVPPDAADRSDWRDVIAALLTDDYDAAALLAQPQLYDLIRFTDDPTGCVYYVLKEQSFAGGNPFRGLGTYVYNPHARRQLNIQSPHSVRDTNTKAQSIEIYLQLQATFLQITGTDRCANDELTPCSGSTRVCSGGGPATRYRISDVAHYTSNLFQPTSDEVSDQRTDLVSISIHGFGPSCNPATNTSLAVISNGTSGTVTNSLASAIAAAYNVHLTNADPPYTGEGGGSCNATPGSSLYRAWPCDNNPFCGQTNTQGRSINGSANACTSSVANADLPEKFIHLEQQIALRRPPDNPTIAGVSWDITIAALEDAFPHETWVDFSHTGQEVGSFCEPYATLTGAIASETSDTFRIKAGTSPETPTIGTPVTLHAFGGAVTIGR
jgi:hypothetical protein